MNIAVNTRLLLNNKLEGIGWFTYETLKRITRQHPEHQFFFFFDRPYDKKFIFSDNITPKILFPQARHPFLFYLWFEHSVANALKKVKADMFISPDGYLSLKTDVPSLAVIHDLNFEHYPRHIPYVARKYYKYYFPKFASKAVRIATVSEFSKQDIIKCYGIDPLKTDVVYDGVNQKIKPLSEDRKKEIREQYSNGTDYFVFVGGLYPRKNIKNLLLAFDKFKNSVNTDFKLLILGQKVWGSQELFSTHNNLKFKNDVIFMSKVVEPETVREVVASAYALTYVSIFEGFGIPILEAMNADVPVITSNVSSMPEIAGDAALYADPFSIDSIANQMVRIVKDTGLKNKLIESAKKQREQFSWDRTAKLLWDSMGKII